MAAMSMQIETTIKAVCEIARRLEETANVSPLSLLKASGYLEKRDQITDEEIIQYLQSQPDLLHAWVLYSENKRVNSGWYIIEPSASQTHRGVWTVGFYPQGEVREFIDQTAACAFFIKREIEYMEAIANSSSSFSWKVRAEE
jgi:hypothetical protein